jgi:hypothetical protein
MEDFDKNVDPQTESASSPQLNEEKAQILQIDFPPPNALLGSKVIVRGRAVPQNPSEEVVVQVNRTLYPPRDGNGYWYVEDDLESLPYPNLTIAARIRDPLQSVSVAIIWQKNCGTSFTFPAAGGKECCNRPNVGYFCSRYIWVLGSEHHPPASCLADHRGFS